MEMASWKGVELCDHFLFSMLGAWLAQTWEGLVQAVTVSEFICVPYGSLYYFLSCVRESSLTLDEQDADLWL